MTTENATLSIEQPAKKKAAKKKASKPAKKNNKFNASLFAKDMLERRQKLDVSYHQMQKDIGINVAIIHRAARKEGISIDSLVLIANWINQPISRYF